MSLQRTDKGVISRKMLIECSMCCYCELCLCIGPAELTVHMCGIFFLFLYHVSLKGFKK